jgi:His/Glu/Gln/Arg/opine family amino acid ABC transporter permease subunit
MSGLRDYFADLVNYAPALFGGLGGFGRGGLVLNVGLAALAVPTSLVLGTLLGSVRAARVPLLTELIVVYTEFLKSVPLILLIFWLHYVLPLLLDVHPPLFVVATVALVSFGSANVAEVVRSGIAAIPRSELEGARLSGLTRWQVARCVVIPQTFSSMAPALMSVSITIFKDTSLTFVIGLVELTHTGMLVANRFPNKLLGMYTLIGLGYLAVCSVLSWVASILKRCLDRGSRRDEAFGVAWQE